MKIFCSEDIFWFQSYWNRDIPHGNFRLLSEILWSSYRPCSQIWHLCVIYVEWSVQWLWHMTGFQLFWINRDGCHMWGRKCSLFPEHLILLIRYTYTLCITEFVSLRTMFTLGLLINDSSLFAWISMSALPRTYVMQLEYVWTFL